MKSVEADPSSWINNQNMSFLQPPRGGRILDIGRIVNEMRFGSLRADDETGRRMQDIGTTFGATDLDALPPNDQAKYSLDPMTTLADAYNHSDAVGLRTFIDFMAGRETDHKTALGRDKAVLTSILEDKIGQLDSALGSAASLGRSATSTFSFIDVSIINSFESGWFGRLGVCAADRNAADEIRLSNLYTDPINLRGIDEKFESVVIHEAAHAAHADLRAGFKYGIDSGGDATLLEEVGAELRARMATHGQYDMQNILSTTHGSYPAEIELFLLLADNAGNEIAPDLLFEAQKSRRDAIGASSARTILRERLDRSVADLLPDYTGSDSGFMQLCEDYPKSPSGKRSEFIRGQTNAIGVTA